MTNSKNYPLAGEGFSLTRAIADVLDSGTPQLTPERKEHFRIREQWGRFASPDAIGQQAIETPHNIRQVYPGQYI
jgi:hypothetical protein